jgi:hypothetical protein
MIRHFWYHSNWSLFRGLLGEFTVAYNIKELISGYQSIDMHCIVLPAKFDAGLCISVLRNKQLLKKRTSNIFQVVQIYIIFKPRILKKGQTLWKNAYFFGAHFSCDRDGWPNFKLYIDSEVLFIYRLMPRKTECLKWLAIFDTTPIGRFRGLLVAFMAA